MDRPVAGKWTRARLVLSQLLLVLLAACGGGADTVENPAGPGGAPSTYTGPPPATADVQAFKINVWDNLKASNRCGQCHVTGGQTPQFVRQDDVNLAYEAANTVVTLSSPKDSQMVLKVGGGHNCWLASNEACADILTTWISNWAGDIAAGGGNIVLEAPPLRDPGASKSFPDDSALFASTVYPLVSQYCSRCHSPGAASPQSPYFASADVDEAYAAARTKINLDQPALSRLVVRLRNEFHNCWSGNCASDANAMQARIQQFAGQVPITPVDQSLVLSKALSLYEGTVASGGNRYNGNVIGLWEFKTGSGTVTYDTSGVEPAIDLTLSGDVTWVGGWGINIRSGKAQGSTANSKKLHDLIKATGEYSVEAWVAPGNVAQEDARIVSYSGGTTTRNFMLGQTLYSYDFLNRSSSSDQNGEPKLTTSADDEDLQATLQHVVATYDPVNGRRIYVNGEFTEDVDPVAGGTLGDWDDTFAFVLGNEVSGDRQFQGVFRLVAIHNRALTPAQIMQNFQAGVGEKFYLLFSVSHLINVPQAYVMFEVSQLDSYGYLFDKPTFISLDDEATPGSIPVAGIRIGINGAEAAVGQAYRTLDTVIDDSNYGPGGQRLSPIGTVIALQKGPESDEFFLTFDVLGNNRNVRTDPVPLEPAPPPDVPRAADVGLRVFDEINATMSELTGVSTQNAGVDSTFQTVKQSLPTVEAIDAFVSAHPVAIAQLAIRYCDALVANQGSISRTQYFPGFNFAAAPATAFASGGDAIIVDSLLGRMVDPQLTTDPVEDEVRSELHLLIDQLAPGGSTAQRTQTVVKATCAALLGSAVTLVQ